MTGVALAEELLLLAYDDETGKATMPRISLDLGMAAAVLVELALAGRIAYAEGSLAVLDPAPTGEPVADEVLVRIAADTPHTPSSWVQRLRHGLRDRILGDLCGRGVVRDVDETELGFIHVHRYPVADASVEADIRRRLAEALTGSALAVSSVEEKPYTRKPYAPFMTSTLQQEAGRKLRFSADRTMRTAQRLYENGYITYMRTDSTRVAPEALTEVREYIGSTYGPDYLPQSPNTYKEKKDSQGAHEAIRPTSAMRHPDQIKQYLKEDEFKVYKLIWQRFVASQSTRPCSTRLRWTLMRRPVTTHSGFALLVPCLSSTVS
jgi:hypothetical protein